MGLLSRLKEMLKPHLPDQRLVEVAYRPIDFNTLLGVNHLGECLPFEAYDPNTQSFINQNTVSFILTMPPLMGASEETIELLHSMMIDTLPSDAVMEVLLWGSPRLAAHFEAYQAYRSQRGGIYTSLAKQRCDHLAQGAHGLGNATGAPLVRDLQVFLVVSLPKTADVDIAMLDAQREGIIGGFNALGVTLKKVEVSQFLQLMRDLLAFDNSLTPSSNVWDPYRPLANQVSDPELSLVCEPDRLIGNQGKQVVKVLHPVRYPSLWPQWAMNDLIGDLYKEPQQLLCPFLMKLTLMPIDADIAQRKTAMKGARADQLASTFVARFMPKIRKMSENWRLVTEQLDEGDQLVSTCFQLVLMADEKVIDRAEAAAKKLFLSKGWTLSTPRFVQFPSWLASLPMAMDKKFLKDLASFNIVQTKLGYNAVNMAPFQGEWKGNGVPLLLLIGRRGQMIWWDPFANNEGNFNIAVAGKSGSGKSVFLQELEAAIVGSGGKVFVIDVGRSSEKTCRLLGGEFIEFSPEAKVSLNPFTFLTELKESLSMLKPLFALMAAPTRKTDDFENALLEKALIHTWEAHGNQAEVTHVASWLRAHQDARAKDLGEMLFTYTPEGSYGRFFSGPCTLTFDNPFVNLELEELKSKKDLQEVVLYMLMYHITEAMYRGDRKTRIACVIDEAWDIFKGDLGAEFIEAGYRRARKYQGLFVSGTQSVSDYYKNPSTQAALDNSDWMCFLSQKAESITQLKASNQLIIDDHMERLLKSVRTVQGEYSEIFIKGPSGYGVGRLVLDPFSRMLYSSKGEEYAAIQGLMNEGYSVSDAISTLLKQQSKKEGVLS